MISNTLNELSIWFTESSTSRDRPILLSKLALLELCGWIECELDRLVLVAETGRLNDANWVGENVIKSTYGLHYDKHFRPMLVKILGEIYTRRVEIELENRSPGALDSLKSLLGQLWKQRCDLAHMHVGATVPQAINYQAPSWSNSRYQDVSRLLDEYEMALATALVAI